MTMKPLLSSAATIVPIVLLVAFLGSCASPTANAPAAQRPPDPPPPVKAQEASPKDRAALHAELGAGYYERGRMDIALEELNEAQTLDPTNPQIYNYYGLVYAMLGENEKAEQNFQRALSLAPADSEIRGNWGWYLCSNGKPRQAIPEFEMALRNPLYKSPEIALINAGRCSVEFGDIANAESYYKRALAQSPNSAPAAYGLALLAYRAGRLDEARQYMKSLAALPAPPPEALFLGMCIERKAGVHSAEAAYVTQLRNRYPDSAEAKSVTTGRCE
jgi:type IV pilus assembly protein PilF